MRPRRLLPAAERKRQIVEATLDVLAAQGLSGPKPLGPTIADVARAAGVSVGLVMLHFKSKEGLIDEALRALGRDYHAALREAADGAGPRAADRLWSLVAVEFSDRVCTPRNLGAWKVLLTVLNGRQPYVREFRDETLSNYALLHDLCRELIAEGGYADRDAKIVARLIDSALGGLWLDLTEATVPITVNEARRIALAQLAIFFPRHFTPRGPRRRPILDGAAPDGAAP